jgi:dCTP deaminase
MIDGRMGILDNDELRKVIPHSVVPYDLEVIDDAHYELSLGSEYYTTASETGTKVQIPEGEQIAIKPGQFAFLITKETVTIPRNVMAFISIKAGVKFRGLINVSGFHVDPGFKGKLKFAVYNAGSKDIVLDWEQRLFPMWFCQLTGDNELYDGVHNNQSSITGNDIAQIQGTVISPNVLFQRFAELEKWVGQLTISAAAIITLGVLGLGLGIAMYVDNSLTESMIEGVERQTRIETNVNAIGAAVGNSNSSIKDIEERLKRLEERKAPSGPLRPKGNAD